MKAIEIEIKFRVPSLDELTQKLAKIGFQVQTPRTFEANLLFDTPDRMLRSSQRILRVRQYGPRWILTYKCVPSGATDGDRHKHREETETEVTDGEALMFIFESLGFPQAFRYEKWRTEWTDGTGHCVVDETPIGNFAELEGPEEWIDAVGPKLGVHPAEYMTLSYGRLFEQWKKQTGSNAANMTFLETSGSAPQGHT